MDFDVASAAWRASKMRRGQMFYYRCRATTRTGTQCSRPAPNRDALAPLYCTQHARYPPPSNTVIPSSSQSLSNSDSA